MAGAQQRPLSNNYQWYLHNLSNWVLISEFHCTVSGISDKYDMTSQKYHVPVLTTVSATIANPPSSISASPQAHLVTECPVSHSERKMSPSHFCWASKHPWYFVSMVERRIYLTDREKLNTFFSLCEGSFLARWTKREKSWQEIFKQQLSFREGFSLLKPAPGKSWEQVNFLDLWCCLKHTVARHGLID